MKKIMKIFWKCITCNQPVLPVEAIEDNQFWQNNGVAILPNNKIITGKVNLHGMFDDQTIDKVDQKNPEIYHAFCYHNSGSPQKFGKSSESISFSDIKEKIEELALLNEIVEPSINNAYEIYLKAYVESDDAFWERLKDLVPRISADGMNIEQVSRAKQYIENLCNMSLHLPFDAIPGLEAEVARQHAEYWDPDADTNIAFKKLRSEIAEKYLKIAEILDKAADDINEVNKEIHIRLTKLDEESSKPQVSVSSADIRRTAQQKIAQTINEHGWMVMAVPDNEGTPFAYTIGLYKNFKHPEIIVTAIDPQQALALLNFLGEQIKEGKKFEIGKTFEKDDASHRHVFLKVENKYYSYYLGSAKDYYNGVHFPAIQRLTADKQEIFPWEKGCDPTVKIAQKVLGKINLT